MEFRSKNLLVTGGSGLHRFKFFIDYILNKYKKLNVINLDLLTYAGNENNTKNFKSNKRYKFIHGNICDKSLVENIFNKYNVDGVINFAAESHVDNSIINPQVFIESNVKTVFSIY